MPWPTRPRTRYWKRLAIVATSKPGQKRARSAAAQAPRPGPRGSGDQAAEARPGDENGQGEDADREVRAVDGGQRLRQRLHALDEVLGHVLHAQAEEVPHLEGGDDDRDARGEAGGHREGHELDEAAETHDAHGEEEDARHQAGQEEPPHPEGVRDRGEDHDERRGGPGDLHPGAAEEGMRPPATIAVYRPCVGGTPEAMASAIERGRATTPTTAPAKRSRRSSASE